MVRSKPKANPKLPGDIGAPMVGMVMNLQAIDGQLVKPGDAICVLSAMKMETVVSSPVSGKILTMLVKAGETVAAGDLLCQIVQ